jgi:hypothetical protein
VCICEKPLAYFTATHWIIKCVAVDSNISVSRRKTSATNLPLSPNTRPGVRVTKKFTKFTLRYGIHALNHLCTYSSHAHVHPFFCLTAFSGYFQFFFHFEKWVENLVNIYLDQKYCNSWMGTVCFQTPAIHVLPSE